MITMSTTSITSRDPKGLQAVRMFEAAYDKAKLDDQRAQWLNEHPEFASRLRLVIDELSEPNPSTKWPPVNEWFELEVDNTADPMNVLFTAGLDTRGWKFIGPKYKYKKILRVKLIEFDVVNVENLEVARRLAKIKGYRLLEGQGRDPFKKKFPRSRSDNIIVFGGNEWKAPGGAILPPDDWYRRVVTLRSYDYHPMLQSNHDFETGHYLWAVVEEGA